MKSEPNYRMLGSDIRILFWGMAGKIAYERMQGALLVQDIAGNPICYSEL